MDVHGSFPLPQANIANIKLNNSRHLLNESLPYAPVSLSLMHNKHSKLSTYNPDYRSKKLEVPNHRLLEFRSVLQND